MTRIDPMTLLERMDRFVHVTRLDRIAMIDRPQPRALRWLPLLVLAALIGGYATMAAAGQGLGHLRLSLIGIGVFIAGFIAANLMRFFGPRLIPGPQDRLDERELVVKARAGAISGAVITIFAIAACFYMGVVDVFGWWRPRTTLEWTYMALAIEGVAFILPVLAASWLTPRPIDED
jgi:hypothetical protein